jgi:hypothetical protein
MNIAPAPSAPEIFPFCVLNAGSSPQTITMYQAGSFGDAAPRAMITSNEPNTAGFFIASDASGRIYVANQLGGPSGEGTVAIYASGATGITPPAGTINFSAGYSPGPIAVDLLGSTYVANAAADQAIHVFAAGAHGNAAPVRTIAGSHTQLIQANGIAVDRAGMTYIVNYGFDPNVVVYAANAHGNARPVAVIAGSKTGLGGPQGIGVDEAGCIYVLNVDSSSVTVYAKGSSGNVPPIATIQGSKTGIFGSGVITVDAVGMIYVTNTMVGRDSVTVFLPGSKGNVAPILTIAGQATGLNEVEGIALLPANYFH